MLFQWLYCSVIIVVLIVILVVGVFFDLRGQVAQHLHHVFMAGLFYGRVDCRLDHRNRDIRAEGATLTDGPLQVFFGDLEGLVEHGVAGRVGIVSHDRARCGRYGIKLTYSTFSLTW